MDMEQKSLQREANEAQVAPLVPPVDIIEDQDGITLKADLPGVTKESLSIDVDGDTLTIEGSVKLGESASMQGVYAEIRVGQYKRSFVLGRDLDPERINASLQNGVLNLRVLKREQAKPRRISIKAD